MDGYSKRTLVEKLGIKQDTNMSVISAPDNYDVLIDEWPIGVSVSRDALDEMFEFIHYFVTKRAELSANFPGLRDQLTKDGMLWVSWPKGDSSIVTDVNENDIREVGLANGLVDVKVAAIDADWSGLKFVWRKEDR